jgi:sugar phosphate isomerase/epimerase
MILTGFTDEASAQIAEQIRITQELGWSHLSARTINTANIHDISDDQFKATVDLLQEHNIQVAEFGTLIGSWSKTIHTDFSITQAEVERCIPRMKQLDVKIARIMSYAQEPWGSDQHEEERFRRLQWITEQFKSEGLIAAHENCMNWGGFSAQHTLRLLEEVPGLQLIFDTGNPIFQRDRSKSEPYPWQDALEFYHSVKHAIVHVHIKDAVMNEDEVRYVYAGEGDGYITEILTDLQQSGYEGFIAIEPHVGKVFHEDFNSKDANREYDIYREYGQRFEEMVQAMGSKTS